MSTFQALRQLPRFLDQSLFVEGLRNKVPVLLPLAGAAFVARDTFCAAPENRKKAFLKSASVYTATIASALGAAHLFLRPEPIRLHAVGESLLKLVKTSEENLSRLEGQLKTTTKAEDMLTLLKGWGVNLSEELKTFVRLAENQKRGLNPAQHHQINIDVLKAALGARPTEETSTLFELLDHARDKVAGPGRLQAIWAGLNRLVPDGKEAKALWELVVPPPENKTGMEMLKEIGKLSGMGLLPVVGGFAGGVLGNRLTGENWREKLKNETKEGFFQFFANIFLCNVGAGLFLLGLERFPKLKNNRVARIAAMTTGIATFGILFGSAIANFFGKNLINPLMDKGPRETFRSLSDNLRNHRWQELFGNLYEERTPEAMDYGLHADDFVAVGFLSGLKWIGTLLSALYTISGVKTGMGFRSATDCAHRKPPEKQPDTRKFTPPLFRYSPLFKPLYYQSHGVPLS